MSPPRSSGVPPRLARSAPPSLRRRPPPLPRPARRPEPLLTPVELERFKNLLVFARCMVEGYFSGKHKSPYRGTSAEFADYKEYVPGDDVGRLDWRVYARTRRLYVRQFEEETDMVVYLLVDVSASMAYAGGSRQSKYVLAAKVAAALAYLMINQGDKTAVALFADTVRGFLPPGGTRRHLHQVVSELEQVRPASTTALAVALEECHGLFRKRGRLVVVSDFLSDRAGFFEALGHFLHRRFEILLLHVVDPDELELPALSTARFEDMETGEQVEVEPGEIRAAYRRTMRESIDELARAASLRQVQHALVRTEHPYLDAIEAYLGFRGRTTYYPQ